MNNLAKISVTAPPETVLKKLSRGKIDVYNLKKQGAHTTFFIKDKTIKKVFAIFAHPCYNVSIVKYGRVHSAAIKVASRAGLVAGLLLFFGAVICAQSFVFAVKVNGSGGYLASEVKSILSAEGVEEGKVYKNFDKPRTIARILALPSVTFCEIERQGTAVIVTVECDEEGARPSKVSPLVSDVNGTLEKLIVVCGTPDAEVGQSVSVGDKLIVPNGNLISGYAQISVTHTIVYQSSEGGEAAQQNALAAVLLYSENATVLSLSEHAVSGGVQYSVTFSYIHTITLNMQ